VVECGNFAPIRLPQDFAFGGHVHVVAVVFVHHQEAHHMKMGHDAILIDRHTI